MGGAQPSVEGEIIKKAVEMAERDAENVDEEGVEVEETNEESQVEVEGTNEETQARAQENQTGTGTGEAEKAEVEEEELPVTLRRIRNEVRWLGLSVSQFNQILREAGLCGMDEIRGDDEEATEVIKEIRNFFYSNRKRLEEYAELLKTVEAMREQDPGFDEAMEKEGVEVSFKNMKTLKEFISSYRQPVVEIKWEPTC